MAHDLSWVGEFLDVRSPLSGNAAGGPLVDKRFKQPLLSAVDGVHSGGRHPRFSRNLIDRRCEVAVLAKQLASCVHRCAPCGLGILFATVYRALWGVAGLRHLLTNLAHVITYRENRTVRLQTTTLANRVLVHE